MADSESAQDGKPSSPIRPATDAATNRAWDLPSDVSLNQLMPKESRPRGRRNKAPRAAAMDNRRQLDWRLGLATSFCQPFSDPSPRINAPRWASFLGSM